MTKHAKDSVLKDGKFLGYLVDSRLMFVGVSVYHFDLFLGMPHGADILLVYQFMLKTSQMQKTNKIWCTNTFIKKGLGIGEIRIIRAKKSLQKLGLIRSHQPTKGTSGKFGKTYIQLNYVETKELRENIRKHFLNKIKENLMNPKYYGDDIPDHPKQGTGKKFNKKTGPAILPGPVKRKVNALRILKNNINALRILKNKGAKAFSFEKDSKGYLYLWDTKLKYYLNTYGIKRNPSKLSKADPKHPNNKYYLYIATKLKDINDSFYDHRNFPNPIKWTDDIRKLAQYDIGCNGTPTKVIKKRLKVVLNHYENAIGQEYSHVLQSGKSFREKFFKVEEAIKRESNFNGKEIGDHFKYMHGTLSVDKGEK